MAGERVHLLAFDENLNGQNFWHVARQGINKRIDGEELLKGSSRVGRCDLLAQVYVRVTGRDVDRA